MEEDTIIFFLFHSEVERWKLPNNKNNYSLGVELERDFRFLALKEEECAYSYAN
jgi:hypothetical protein